MSRDQYGHYVNKKGVTIKVHQDKSGKDHISFYEGPADGNHASVHVNVDYRNGGSWTSKSHGTNHSNTEPGSGNCFLTTACLKFYSENFDDNCYELQTLRWFRDHYVSQEEVDHYYQIAPFIVNHINLLPNVEEIYHAIYCGIIQKCLAAIENKDYNAAYSTYKNAVLELERKFLDV